MRVMDESDKECTQRISTWHSLWEDAIKERDGEMINELRHMHNVHHPLSSMDRRVLFGNMMNRGIYWGDEFALQTMEKVLNCMFVVVNERLHIIQREYDVDAGSRDWIALLLLRGQHYEPIHDNTGAFSWNMDSIPEPLRPMIDNLLRKGQPADTDTAAAAAAAAATGSPS
jgi:hypothetical protein